jgi:hypothetical protein
MAHDQFLRVELGRSDLECVGLDRALMKLWRAGRISFGKVRTRKSGRRFTRTDSMRRERVKLAGAVRHRDPAGFMLFLERCPLHFLAWLSFFSDPADPADPAPPPSPASDPDASS